MGDDDITEMGLAFHILERPGCVGKRKFLVDHGLRSVCNHAVCQVLQHILAAYRYATEDQVFEFQRQGVERAFRLAGEAADETDPTVNGRSLERTGQSRHPAGFDDDVRALAASDFQDRPWTSSPLFCN